MADERMRTRLAGFVPSPDIVPSAAECDGCQRAAWVAMQKAAENLNADPEDAMESFRVTMRPGSAPWKYTQPGDPCHEYFRAVLMHFLMTEPSLQMQGGPPPGGGRGAQPQTLPGKIPITPPDPWAGQPGAPQPPVPPGKPPGGRGAARPPPPSGPPPAAAAKAAAAAASPGDAGPSRSRAEAGLASDWREATDGATQRRVWLNLATGEQATQRPRCGDWQLHHDLGARRCFWHNSKTGASSWTEPQGRPPPPQGASPVTGVPPSPHTPEQLAAIEELIRVDHLSPAIAHQLRKGDPRVVAGVVALGDTTRAVGNKDAVCAKRMRSESHVFRVRPVDNDAVRDQMVDFVKENKLGWRVAGALFRLDKSQAKLVLDPFADGLLPLHPLDVESAVMERCQAVRSHCENAVKAWALRSGVSDAALYSLERLDAATVAAIISTDIVGMPGASADQQLKTRIQRASSNTRTPLALKPCLS
eukprot:TRINITY_DN51161_c0_g1_i1.p1 TRINITY_DN51161_c0_g1~~TRINITY_DN51161_c0_g1_i1.p1  ORF type:complete len:527 (+),score=129.24 TRINITY_DN51161_c0_g1_i1:158-1582(+)